ncbi:hypothetical protein SAY86_008503 [Trapa natans]|uniref:Uncharacterized protein n=1 Tax=Trapa natans TaxID=22666 RepID=A0AAN7K8L0_TRANT|nr:hypothetical protein SAY86_008503 [Trapa natans]
MDLWMVAAATGAGYIAKHWQQNLQSRVNNDDSDSQERARHGQHQFMKVFQQIREQTDPLRRLSNKRASKLDYLLGKNFQELIHYPPDDGSRQPGDAAADGFDDYANVISLGRLEQQQSAVTDESAELGDGYYARLNGKYRDYKMISNLHSLQQLDPQIPSENFFAYQFYNRHAGIDRDDGHLSPRESALGPLSITDVTRVLSRPSSDIEMEMKSQEELSWIIRPNLPLRPAKNAAKKGPSDGELFFLGLTIGMMTSIVTSSNQVDSLNEKLKQAKNLVKDLQEELEMKDMLTVKEIEETPKEESSSSCCDQEEARPEDTEKSEAMSKIEAELEAELERLELNMKTTTSDNIFEFDELDPDMEMDIVRGGPNLGKLGDSSDSDRDNSEACDDLPQTPNFSVSPKELTLRLHEVIESRLKERTLELEAALEGTQMRLSALSGNPRRASPGEPDGPWSRGRNLL